MPNIHCPSCRAAIPKCIENVKIAGCPKCGMVSTMGDRGVLYPVKTYSILSSKFQEPFLLEEKIRYNSIHYTIYAIYKYFVKYEELDSEDKKWVQGSGYVTEWYAKSDNNQLLTITRDVDDRFYTVLPKHSNQLSDWQIKETGTEFGTFELNSFVGIDDEPLDISGHYRCYPTKIMLESEKIDFTQRDFKAFSLKPINSSQLKRMKIIFDTTLINATEDFKDTTFYRNVFGIALLVILGLMLWANMGKYTPIGASRSINFEYKTNPDGKPDTLALKPQSGGIFDLKAGKNYLFEAESNVSGTNKDLDFSVSIVRKEDETTVSEVDIAFYTESGRDSEGDWTEDFLSDNFKFQVDKTGKYEVFVSPDYDDLEHIPPCSVSINIRQTGYNYYYFMASGVFLLAFLIFQWQRENIVAFANLPHGTYLHDLTGQ